MTLVDTLVAKSPPLRIDEHGVLIVGGTRVPLDTVIGAFHEGATPEEIVIRYDALHLADVYEVIAFYLNNRTRVDEYLDERGRQAEEIRREIEARFPPAEIRERLLARRKARG